MYIEVIDDIITVRVSADYSDNVREVVEGFMEYLCGDCIDYYQTSTGVKYTNKELVASGVISLLETQKVDSKDAIVSKTEVEMYQDGTKELDKYSVIDQETNEVREKTNTELYAENLLKLGDSQYWDQESEEVKEYTMEEQYKRGILSEENYLSVLTANATETRKTLITDVTWYRERHIDEQTLGVTTTLTTEEYLILLQYIQNLRDITLQAGYPTAIIWPQLSL